MTNKKDVSSHIHKFKNKLIGVVGDVILDEYIYGYSDRLSPEAPVPIVNVDSVKHVLGGAANVARNIKSLSGNPLLFSVVDTHTPSYKDFEKLLCLDEINNTSIINSKNRILPQKTRILSRNQQVVRLDREVVCPITNKDADKLATNINDSDISVLIIQDYAKGIITQRFIDNLKEIKHSKTDLFILVDPNPKNIIDYRGTVDIFKPNLEEARQLTKLHNFYISRDEIPAMSFFNEISESLFELTRSKIIVLTLGEHGMIYIEDGIPKFYVKTNAQDVYDVSGAGDTTIATLALSMSSGMSIKDSVIVSNTAAGIVVEKLGTSVLSMSELLSKFK